MKYNPQKHHRRSIRLKGYDYSQAGLYFITICAQNRACLFGEIVVGPSLVGAPLVGAQMGAQMVLNDGGKMVETEWLKLPNRFTNIELHEFVVMPNHFHGILEITVGAPLVGALRVDTQNTPDTQNGRPEGQPEGQPQGIAPTGHAPTTITPDISADAPTDTAKNKTVGDMMDAFKSITTVEYIRGVKTLGWQPFDGKLWQRNYWEHIIRNYNEYQRISEYIINNPQKWDNDKLNNKDNL